MGVFSKDEKCAMLLACSQLGAIQDERMEQRTILMMAFHRILGVSIEEFVNYSLVHMNDFVNILQKMDDYKKMKFTTLILALAFEDGKMTNEERDKMTSLFYACQISDSVMKMGMEEYRNVVVKNGNFNGF